MDFTFDFTGQSSYLTRFFGKRYVRSTEHKRWHDEQVWGDSIVASGGHKPEYRDVNILFHWLLNLHYLVKNLGVPTKYAEYVTIGIMVLILAVPVLIYKTIFNPKKTAYKRKY